MTQPCVGVLKAKSPSIAKLERRLCDPAVIVSNALVETPTLPRAHRRAGTGLQRRRAHRVQGSLDLLRQLGLAGTLTLPAITPAAVLQVGLGLLQGLFEEGQLLGVGQRRLLCNFSHKFLL